MGVTTGWRARLEARVRGRKVNFDPNVERVAYQSNTRDLESKYRSRAGLLDAKAKEAAARQRLRTVQKESSPFSGFGKGALSVGKGIVSTAKGAYSGGQAIAGFFGGLQPSPKGKAYPRRRNRPGKFDDDFNMDGYVGEFSNVGKGGGGIL